ncbi:MAG: SDR family NAD(P)-dependent oxidoreductase [Candidatus Pelethousia sp.]|nr:SDR family NAD(P)-dependent oxidoreductase [Candidatus Pelethousia sp.]
MKIAVITGASSGIGREFVLALDKAEQFDEVWLIARRLERLEALALETRAKARLIALDLTKEESVAAYAQLLGAHKPEIAVLVNASGFGKFKAFEDEPLAVYSEMIDLNAKALMAMTYVSLPYMGRGGRIYEMGSLSAFQPVPYINVYAATKAFVLSFTRALNAEMKGRGVRAMAICPGWVKTEFFEHAMSDSTITYFNRYYEAKDVVRRALRDMAKGKDVSIVGFPIRAQVFLTKLLPHRLVMKIWLKQQKKG